MLLFVQSLPSLSNVHIQNYRKVRLKKKDREKKMFGILRNHPRAKGSFNNYVGRWSPKGLFMSKFRVRNAHVEVDMWSKKNKTIST